ncbi:retrovirus-related pol polyprotein from transposon TNT 1-94 [Tanacetum coccineum]
MAKASPTQAWLWHRRLSHLNFDYITLLSKKEVVNGLPKQRHGKLDQDQTPHAFISKKKSLNIKLPLCEHLNRTALSKDGTFKRTLVEAARARNDAFSFLSFHYHFGLKQLQPHATTPETDQSHSVPPWKDGISRSKMTGNLQ